jgi:hypothetical protein
MIYDPSLKAERMVATRDHVAGGTLELLGADGAVLASFPLSDDGGSVAESDNTAIWTLTLANAATTALAKGEATQAQVRRAAADGGEAAISDLAVASREAVGRGAHADVIIDNPRLVAGQRVTLDSVSFTHA